MGDAITYSEMNFTKKHNSRISSGSAQKEDMVTYAAVNNQSREKKKTAKSNKTQQVSPQADDVSLLYALVNKPKKAAEKNNKKVAKTEEVSPKEEDKGFMYTAISKLNKSAQKDNKTQQDRRQVILLVCVLIVICVILLITVIFLGVTCREDQIMANNKHHSNCSSDLSPRCPDLWITINDKCYFFSEIQKSRTDSAKDCEDRGSSLATVKEKTIRRLVTITGKEFWVGLSQYNRHGETWIGKWTDGSTETVSEGTGSCAKLGSRLTLENCYANLYWICERDAVCPH